MKTPLFGRRDIHVKKSFAIESHSDYKTTLGIELFKNRNAVLDDGCCPELVMGARFDGILEIPFIEKPSQIYIPKELVPFSRRNGSNVSCKETAVCFYEKDANFADVLISPQQFIEDFPDSLFSYLLIALFTEMPLCQFKLQMFTEIEQSAVSFKDWVYTLSLK